MKNQTQTRFSRGTYVLVECAVMVALATVLSMLKIYDAPLGGSVTLFSMVPIILVALRHGFVWGSSTAFVYSLTQLLLGLSAVAYVPTPVGIVLCVLLDYIVAFTVLGLAGSFKKVFSKPLAGVITGIVLACLLRYVSHVFSGAIVWYEITKTGGWNDYVNKVGMWTYSLVYNAQYMVPETLITLVAAPVCLKLMNYGRKKA